VPDRTTYRRRQTTRAARPREKWTIGVCITVFVAGAVSTTWAQTPDVLAGATETANSAVLGLQDELSAALVRLPLAAVLGAALALRPRRKGTPERSMPVIETQIILAVVGALIMLIVGASLARAFGIVGAANLIRYRAKIDDPKDAVVMLSALAVGLASGVGLFGLAVFGTVFTAAILWAIEGFEPAERKVFDLTLKREEGVADLKTQVEQVLRRFRTDYEIRASAEDLLSYVVTTRRDFQVDRVSEALTALAPEKELAVEWAEAKPKKKAA
jgi:uncharacterized membrane protein YhiD involved in acid resistance